MSRVKRLVKTVLNRVNDALIPYLLLQLNPGHIGTLLSDVQLFFIVGLGRSGTTFLSHLLNQISTCIVYHEISEDREALVNAYWHPEKAWEYLSTSRKTRIAARVLFNQGQKYGEVNSYLRYHVDALKDMWNPIILHLVRDGKKVIRSIMNRQSFTLNDPRHTGNLYPYPDDPYSKEWDQMDRFSRVCWYWASTNQYLLDRQIPVIRLEDITTSYENFSSQVLLPLEIDLSFEIWSQQISSPQNASTETGFPSWEDWTNEQKGEFTDICGEVMTNLGYPI